MNSLPIGYWQPGRNSTTGQCQSSHRVSCLLWDGHGPGIWGLGHESFTGASPASLLQLRFASLHRCRSRGRLLVRQKFATLLPLTATQWIETKAALKVQGGCKLFFFPITRFAFIALSLSSIAFPFTVVFFCDLFVCRPRPRVRFFLSLNMRPYSPLISGKSVETLDYDDHFGLRSFLLSITYYYSWLVNLLRRNPFFKPKSLFLLLLLTR
jgi:hypothetical protein